MTVRASNINQDRDCHKFITSTTRSTDASDKLSEWRPDSGTWGMELVPCCSSHAYEKSIAIQL